MISAEKPPVRVADGVWWLGGADENEFERTNAYLVHRDGIAALIDPGPASGFERLRAAAESIAPIRDIAAIFVTDSSPAATSSLPLWVSAGFSGTVVAHWRVAMTLQSYGVVLRVLSEHRPLGSPHEDFLGLRTVLFPYAPNPGSLGVFDSETSTLFSGDLFSCQGLKLPLIWTEGFDRRMMLYHETLLPSTTRLLAALDRVDSLQCARACPLHGPIVEGNVGEVIESLRSAHCGKIDENLEGYDDQLSEELTALRQKTFGLQEIIVMTEDGRLRDPLTGLYTVEYLEHYAEIFASSALGGTLAYLRLDQMKAYNNDFGFAAGNEAVSILSSIVVENRSEDTIAFRGPGPALYLCVPNENSSQGEIDRLRRAIANSGAFKRDVTTSVAIATVSEAESAQVLLSLVRERSRLLDSLGPDSLCSSSGEEPRYRSGRLVIAESDPFLRAFLSEYFESRKFATLTARDGGEALELIDANRPVLVVAELNTAGFDGFQIRERMDASAELKNIPLVLLTFVKDEKTVRRAMAAGIRHVLKKPVMMAELEGLVRLMWEDADVS